MSNTCFMFLLAIIWNSLIFSEGSKLSEIEQELAGKGDSYKTRVGRQWTVSNTKLNDYVKSFV